MSRISRENLEYCNTHNECLDCHSAGKVKTATRRQRRREFDVPCCQSHFNAYKSKMNEPNARKYARRAQKRQKIGQCSACHRTLIPRELLPPWIREITCGMHGSFKAFRLNRTTMIQFITVHCLTPAERENMTAQNIVFSPDQSFTLFGMRYPGHYQTKVFSTQGLLQLYRKFHQE